MKHYLRLLLTIGFLLVCTTSSLAFMLDFEGDKPGYAPGNWKEIKGNWYVRIIPEKQFNHVLAIEGKEFQSIIIWQGEEFENVKAEADVKIIGGEIDPTAGLVVGFKSYEDTFYVCRINPLEHNFVLWEIKGNQRLPVKKVKTFFASKDAWGKMGIEVKNGVIHCFYRQNDQEARIEYDALNYSKGKVGFWIKADAQTYFDNLKVE